MLAIVMQYPLRSAVLSFCSEGYMRHSTSQILRMLPDLPMKVMGVGEWKERETSGYLFSVLPPGLIKMLAVTHSCRHGFPFHGSSLLSTRATSSSSFCPDTPCPTNILILAIGQFPGKWTLRGIFLRTFIGMYTQDEHRLRWKEAGVDRERI